MFTGLVEDIGTLVAIQRGAAGARLTVECHLPMAEIQIGDSVAVDGACLTVVAIDGPRFCADVSLETLQRTTLGDATAGHAAHLERALALGDRLGGHLVQGHVDGVGTKVGQERVGEGWDVSWEIPELLLDTVVEKGSVAIDGVSLTVSRLAGRRVTVAIVPHTATETTLTRRPVGSHVNVETDLVGKYVQRILTRRSGDAGVTLDALKKAGFA
ncbi:MAG: riboflavin synthase [Myxococcota bacterium]|nr:riboflavin synthase [Myxococcota bacterium]